MLTEKEFDDLSSRLERLSCTDRKAGDGLFTFVMLGEPQEGSDAYKKHLEGCEFCRTALQTYRYKRDAAKLFSKWETGKRIVSKAKQPGSDILTKELGDHRAYFQSSGHERQGITVVVDSTGAFVSIEEQSLDDFQELRQKNLNIRG